MDQAVSLWNQRKAQIRSNLQRELTDYYNMVAKYNAKIRDIELVLAEMDAEQGAGRDAGRGGTGGRNDATRSI